MIEQKTSSFYYVVLGHIYHKKSIIYFPRNLLLETTDRSWGSFLQVIGTHLQQYPKKYIEQSTI